MKNYFNHISFKISSVIFIVFFAVILIIFSSLSSHFTSKSLEEKVFDVKGDIFSLQETMSFLIAKNETEQIQKTIAFFGTHANLTKALLINNNKHTIASSRVEDVNKSIKSIFAPSVFSLLSDKFQQSTQNKKTNVWLTHDKKILYAIAPIISAKLSPKSLRQEDINFLFFEYQLDNLSLMRSGGVTLFFPIALALLFAAIAIVTYIHFVFSRRIKIIQHALEQFTDDNVPSFLSVKGNDELSKVSYTFNEMVSRIFDQNQYLHQYKNMIASSLDMQALIDKNFVYMAVNPAYAAKFNLTVDQVVRQKVIDILGEEYFNSITRISAEHCFRGETVCTSQWMTFPTGNKKHMEMTFTPYYKGDDVHGFVFIARDMTKRKQAELKLDESNTLLNNVINSTPDLMFAKNREHQYILVNQAFAKAINQPVDRLIGTTDHQQNFTIEQISGFEQEDHDVLSGLTIHNTSSSSQPKDKQIIEMIKSPLKRNTGEVIGIIGIGHDITEHIRDLAKISQQQKELSQIIDAMFDAVITIDETGIIQTFNKAAERIFGFSTKEAIGYNIKLLMPKEHAEQHDGYIDHYLKTDEKGIMRAGREVIAQTKDKRLFPVNLLVAELPINTSGKRRFIGVCQDLTKIKRQEALYNRSEKMDALGKLTGGIAHDYNNMLGVILGYCDILKMQLTEQPKLLNYVEQISQAGARGAQLTRKLLSFSSRSPAESSNVNINDLINKNIEMLTKTLVTVELKLKLNKNIAIVNIDSHSFEDMLLNMSINAMHAMPNGGQLTISTSQISLSKEQAHAFNIETGEFVLLSIEDNGCGMSKKTKESIFQPFFSTKGDRGTGLGLSQVYGFIKSSAGAIDVYSELGTGTRFLLYFPVKTTSVDHQLIDEKEEQQEFTGNETILVVDDEEQLCSLASEILVAKGYHVLTAVNGIEALAVLKLHDVDLLFSDIMMPKMNGYQLVEQVKKLYPHIKILLASGFQEESLASKVALSEPVIVKPYVATELFRRIRHCLDQSESKNKLHTKQSVVARMEWTADMSIDDGGMLDDDHKQLYSLLNRCQALLGENDIHQPLKKIVAELIEYTHGHFAREELAMSVCHYPYYKNHCEVHQMMMDKLTAVINSKSDQDILMWLAINLNNWFDEHIMVMDKSLQPYFAKHKDEIRQALIGNIKGNDYE